MVQCDCTCECAEAITKATEVIAGSGSSTWSTAAKVLEIGLVVFVVLLVIIGLIVGFSRLSQPPKDDLDDFDSQTYY